MTSHMKDGDEQENTAYLCFLGALKHRAKGVLADATRFSASDLVQLLRDSHLYLANVIANEDVKATDQEKELMARAALDCVQIASRHLTDKVTDGGRLNASVLSDIQLLNSTIKSMVPVRSASPSVGDLESTPPPYQSTPSRPPSPVVVVVKTPPPPPAEGETKKRKADDHDGEKRPAKRQRVREPAASQGDALVVVAASPVDGYDSDVVEVSHAQPRE